jgi:O-antigen ligase
MNSIIRKIIFSTVFILPFIIFSGTVFPMVFSKSLFFEGATLTIGALWIIGRLFKTGEEAEKIPRNIVFIVFGVYVFFLLISALHSFVPGLSFWGSFDHGTGVVFMLCLFLFSLVVGSVFKKIEDWHKLFTVFVVSGLFFNVGTFLTMAGVPLSKTFSFSALSGFLFGNSSWTGIYLIFVFFIGLGLVFSSRLKSERIVGFLGLATSFLNPSLSGFLIQVPGTSFGFIGLARTASYSLFAGVFLFVLYLFFRKITSQKWRKMFIGSFLAVSFIGLILISTVGFGPMRQFISEKAGPNRFVFWEISLSALAERPVLGWGGDSYQYVYVKYFDPIVFTPGYTPAYWVDRAHSIYFDELVSGGITGFLLLMLLYGILLFGLVRSAIKTREEEGLLYMALFSAVVAFLIQGLMMFQINIGWFIIAILLAFVANFCFKDRNTINTDAGKEDKKNRDGNHTFEDLSLVVVVVAFGFLFNYLIIKPYDISHKLAEFPTASYEKRLELYKEIDEAYIGNTTDLGNAFLPYHVRLRQILAKGSEKEEEKQLMINEIKEINRILDNSLKRQEYKELKILMGMSGLYSVIMFLTDGEERQAYYDESMFYVEKMKIAAPQSPASQIAKELLDSSLEYGKDGLELLNFDKSKVKK